MFEHQTHKPRECDTRYAATMDVELWEPAPSRPCHLCLSLDGGAVFVDFALDADGVLFVARISFDGFGCCEAPPEIGRMGRADSQLLTEMAVRRAIDPRAVEPILRRYLADNQHWLWSDALRSHGLV